LKETGKEQNTEITIKEIVQGNERVPYESPRIIQKWKLTSLQINWQSYSNKSIHKMDYDVEIEDLENIHINQSVKHNPQIEGTVIGSEVALINIENFDCHILNNIGGLVYLMLLEGAHILEDIAYFISKRCQTDKTLVQKDLIKFFKQLMSEKLIKFQ